jgi:hypothetical protein
MRGIWLAVSLSMLVFSLPALAQENLDRGKTPEQLFASDCAICHKSPQGLAKAGRLFGLDNFLREHYTASRESAAKLAAYLQAVGEAPGAPAKRGKRDAKSSDRPKGAANKDRGKKPADAKPSESSSSDSKSSDKKAGEAKAEPKDEPTNDSKNEPKAETKSEAKTETKTEIKSEAKSEPKAETKTESKSEPKSPADAKPDKPEKSD